MFRLKITFLSVFFSGIVLAVFGFYFLLMSSKINLDRIDREIKAIGESQLTTLHPKAHWKNLGASLSAIYGDKNINKLIIKVVNKKKRSPYKSANWPETISMDSFPEFNSYMLMPPRPRIDGKLSPRAKALSAAKYIKQPVLKTFHLQNNDFRVGIMGNNYFTLIVGMDLESYYHEAKIYRTMTLVAIPFALLLLAAGGWIVTHRAIAPVRMIAETAKNITAHDLYQRIPDTEGSSEFKDLIWIINEMLDRLEKSFRQAVRFSADAAHELQTPLTILQGILDDGIRNAREGSEEQLRSSSLLEEVRHLKIIVQKLLILSRADAGKLNLLTENVNLSNILSDIIEDMELIAADLSIEHSIQPDVDVEADPYLIRQVIQNLALNAVKYNIPGGFVKFYLIRENNFATLKITNNGEPISPEEQKLIFNRFYRIDQSRSNKVPGSGLGLSLAKEITLAHKGNLTIETTPEEKLITFTLTLPVK